MTLAKGQSPGRKSVVRHSNLPAGDCPLGYGQLAIGYLSHPSYPSHWSDPSAPATGGWGCAPQARAKGSPPLDSASPLALA